MFRAKARYDAVDLNDATQALNDAKLLTDETLNKIKQYDGCLAGGLCWLRNNEMLTQKTLDTLLNSANPYEFSKLITQLMQTSVFSPQIYNDFSQICMDSNHLIEVNYILAEMLRCCDDTRHVGNEEKNRNFVSQLTNKKIANDVAVIFTKLNRISELRERYPKDIYDLFTKAENKPAWEQLVIVLQENKSNVNKMSSFLELVKEELLKTQHIDQDIKHEEGAVSLLRRSF
jgi:hypothetical protein